MRFDAVAKEVEDAHTHRELRLELGSARKIQLEIQHLELQKKELRINELEVRVQELLTQLATLFAAACSGPGTSSEIPTADRQLSLSRGSTVDKCRQLDEGLTATF